MQKFVRKMLNSQNGFIEKHKGLKNYTVDYRKNLVFFICNDGEEFNCDIIEFSE